MDPRPDGYEYECLCGDDLYHVGHKYLCQLYNLKKMRQMSERMSRQQAELAEGAD